MNCECGCGLQAPVYRGKQCRYLRGHCGAQKARKMIRYVEEQGTGCWIWLLGTRDGYGIEKVGGKYGGAHVHSYEKHRGPVPVGMVLDHVVCGNRRCVNPWHLEIVTPTINSRRGRNAKINQEIADEMRRMKASGITQTEIARVFGVSWSLVSDVVRGNTWKPTACLAQGLSKMCVRELPQTVSRQELTHRPQTASRPDKPIVFAAAPTVLAGKRIHWSNLLRTSIGSNNSSVTKLRDGLIPLPMIRSPPSFALKGGGDEG